MSFAPFRNPSFVVCFLIATIFTIGIYCIATPYWETNDDVGMSMIAHGYGERSIPSSDLIFSNKIWGEIIGSIPTLDGIYGYSLGQIICLIMCSASILFIVLKSGHSMLAGLAVFILITIRPLLFPQFTITAGLLTLTAIAFCILYASQPKASLLLLAAIMACCGFLIRKEEFILVALVALPALLTKTLFKNRVFRIFVFCLSIVILCSFIYDRSVYQTPEWLTYRKIHSVLSQLVDFGTGNTIRAQSELMEKYGYSSNDIALLSEWFFVDSSLTDYERLQSLTLEAKTSPQGGYLSYANARKGMSALFRARFAILITIAIIFLFLNPSWRILGLWLSILTVLFAIGYIGRPAILRIYEPLADLLVLFSLILPPAMQQSTLQYIGSHPLVRFRQILRRNLPILLCLAAIAQCTVVLRESFIQHKRAIKTQELFASLSFDSPLVVWGDALPYTRLYPVLGGPKLFTSLETYSLGSSTLSPGSSHTQYQRQGNDLISMLNQGKTISLIAYAPLIEKLAIYCQEHLGLRLEILKSQIFEQEPFTLFFIRATK